MPGMGINVQILTGQSILGQFILLCRIPQKDTHSTLIKESRQNNCNVMQVDTKTTKGVDKVINTVLADL